MAVRPALAYWLATSLLNPAVLAFAARAAAGLMGLRLGAGAVVLVLAAWLAPRRADEALAPVAGWRTVQRHGRGPRPPGSPRVLGGMTVRLVPEYLRLVFLPGAFGGALSRWATTWPHGDSPASSSWPSRARCWHVPTGGEVAVVAALLAAGAPPWLAAALLVTLPAASLPSLAMVWTSFRGG